MPRKPGEYSYVSLLLSWLRWVYLYWSVVASFCIRSPKGSVVAGGAGGIFVSLVYEQFCLGW